ncbi:hypothetical protein GTW69_06765 [Streptomyces sp. SID7760]|nr:hypothetical protein [Streptomyces sp. SID7760]
MAAGEVGDARRYVLHHAAQKRVGSREPLTRKAIVDRSGEAIAGTGRTESMAAVLEVLPAHAMFPDIGWAHWQVGRRGDR